MSIGYCSPLAGLPFDDQFDRSTTASRASAAKEAQIIETAYAVFALECAGRGHAGLCPELFMRSGYYKLPAYGDGQAEYPGGWLPGIRSGLRAEDVAAAAEWRDRIANKAAAEEAAASAKAEREKSAFVAADNRFAALRQLKTS